MMNFHDVSEQAKLSEKQGQFDLCLLMVATDRPVHDLSSLANTHKKVLNLRIHTEPLQQMVRLPTDLTNMSSIISHVLCVKVRSRSKHLVT